MSAELSPTLNPAEQPQTTTPDQEEFYGGNPSDLLRSMGLLDPSTRSISVEVRPTVAPSPATAAPVIEEAPTAPLQPTTAESGHRLTAGEVVGTAAAITALGAMTLGVFGFGRRRARRQAFTQEAARDVIKGAQPTTYNPGAHFAKTTLKRLPGEPGHYQPVMDSGPTKPHAADSGNPDSMREEHIGTKLDNTMRRAYNARMEAAPIIALYGEGIADHEWVEARIASGRFTATEAYKFRQNHKRVRGLLDKADKLEEKVRRKANP